MTWQLCPVRLLLSEGKWEGGGGGLLTWAWVSLMWALVVVVGAGGGVSTGGCRGRQWMSTWAMAVIRVAGLTVGAGRRCRRWWMGWSSSVAVAVVNR